MNEWYCSKFGSRQKCNFIFLFFSLSLSLSRFSLLLSTSPLFLCHSASFSLSLSLSLSHVLGPPVSLIEPPILLLSSAAVVVWIFFFGYRGMDRDRLQWVFDDGGFANTVSLDLVVVFNLSPSHFSLTRWFWAGLGWPWVVGCIAICGFMFATWGWVVFGGVLLVVMGGDHGGFGLWSWRRLWWLDSSLGEREREREREVLGLEKLNDYYYFFKFFFSVVYIILMCCNVKIKYLK